MDKTTTTKAGDSLEAALAKIDTLLAPAAPTEHEFATREDFDAYVSAEIAKAEADTNAEAKAARLTALKAAIEIGKASSWEQGSTTKIAAFHDKWQKDAVVEKNVTPPAALPATTAFKYEAVETVKSFIAPLLKAAQTPEGQAEIAKAGGEATAALERIAKLFGIKLGDNGVLDCEVSWQVRDAVGALQQAAKMEAVLSGMTDIMKASATEPVAPVETAPVVAPSDVTKSLVSGGITKPGQATDGAGWPIDMNA